MGVPETNPAAATTPHPWQGVPRGQLAHPSMDAVVRPLLKVPRGRPIHFRPMGPVYFASPGESDALLFPTLHPLHPQERYDWFVVAEDQRGVMIPEPYQVISWRDNPRAIKLGWLRDEQDVVQPSLAQKEEFMRATAPKNAELGKKMADLQRLVVKCARGGYDSLTRDEQEAYARLDQEVDRLRDEWSNSIPNER